MSADLPFEAVDGEQPKAKTEVPQKVRFRRAVRDQVSIALLSEENALPLDHEARIVLDFVRALDLSAFYAQLGAVEGKAGRNPNDPQALIALWLYATIDGVGSARHLADLCTMHLAYRYLAGGLSVGYRTLADFRRAYSTELDDLLTQSVARLVRVGAVTLTAIAVDGCKIKAHAGARSYRSQPTLEKLEAEAAARVQALKDEVEKDPAAGRNRRKERELQATERRLNLVRRAQENLPPEQPKKRKKREPRERRASTTDPDARKMRMGDGGYASAYNVQFGTDVGSDLFVASKVTNQGNDGGQLSTIVDQCAERYGLTPREVLADGGYATKLDVACAAKRGFALIGPVLQERPRASGRKRQKSSPEFDAWRVAMATEENKARYKRRAPTAELPHAHLRNRGLRQFKLRGFDGVTAEIRWQVLAHNYRRTKFLTRKRD